MTPPRLEVRPLDHLTIHRPITASTRVRNEMAVQAAGALVWRVVKGKIQVLLVHRPRYDDWSWPKGKLDPGESPAVAAVREVKEETGEEVVLGVPLPGLKYRMDGRPKQVHFWAARVATSSDRAALAVRAPVEPSSDDEIDDVAWIDADRAMDQLTYASDIGPLDALLALHGAGRLDTISKVFVRHTRARARSAWKKGEASRPLTPQGKERAQALVPLLAAIGVTEVVSSPWRRCMDTVAPYAEVADLSVVSAPALTEDAHEKHPDKAVKVLSRLMKSKQTVAVCLHRPVVPAVLDMANEYTSHSTLGEMPLEDPYLRTGELLVAQVAKVAKKTQIVTLERMRPVVNGN